MTQKIPKTFKQRKSIIWWHNLGVYFRRRQSGKHCGSHWNSTGPGSFWGPVHPSGASMRPGYMLQTRLCLCINFNLSWSLYFLGPQFTLSLYWGVCWGRLNDLTISKHSTVPLLLESHTVLRLSKHLTETSCKTMTRILFLWPEDRSELNPPHSNDSVYTSGQWYFFSKLASPTPILEAILPEVSPLDATSAHIHSLFRLFLNSFVDVKNRIRHSCTHSFNRILLKYQIFRTMHATLTFCLNTRFLDTELPPYTGLQTTEPIPVHSELSSIVTLAPDNLSTSHWINIISE